MKQITIKITAILMVVLMIFSISSPTISFAVNELLTEHELESQGLETNNKSVEFDVYGEDEKHSITTSLSEFAAIYVKVKVKDAGHLDDAIVDFSNANFVITEVDKPELVGEIEPQKLKLNRISGGDTVIIKAIIKSDVKDEISADFFNKDNHVSFNAKYFNEKEKETKVQKDMVIHVSWNKKDLKLETTQNISKYIFVTSEEQRGVLIQEDITTKVENNELPIKTSHIEIDVPKIEEELPVKVSVISKNLEGTDKRLSDKFNSDNWEYDNKTGLLTIDILNEADNNNMISWAKNAQDDFAVIYTYSEQVLEKIEQAGAAITLHTRVNNSMYNDVDTVVSNEVSTEVLLTEQIGSLLDLNVQIIEEEINKGFIYANKVASNENQNETIYNEKYLLTVSDAELTGNITIEQGSEILLSGDNSYAANNSVNKELEVNAEQVMGILGQDGNINILANNETIATINKDTKIEKNGNYSVNLQNVSDNIVITLSKPIQEGNIEFNIEKAIAKELSYSEEEIQAFEKIQTNTAIYTDNDLPVNKEEDSANLVEPTSKAVIELSTDSFSTISNNNKLEIKAILESDSIDDKLHDNTIMEFRLPTYIEDVTITNCKVMYTDELVKSTETLIDSESGKVIRIELEGMQTQYNTDIEKGINIVVNADLSINRLTPSKTEKIDFVYKDANDENTYSISKDINFVAPTGIVTVNELSNYAKEAQKISLINGEEGNDTAYIDAYSEASIAVFQGQIINNNKNDISDTKILGFIPNASRDGNTFDTNLNSAIVVSNDNVTIYYSEEANPNNNLEDSNNKWKTEVSDWSSIKSYLIVPNENMAQGSSLQFAMAIKTPENIAFNNTDNINYSISYNNNTQMGTIAENVDGSNIVMTTGNGPTLETEISIDERLGTSLKQSQHANFTVKIKNTGSDATNVKLVVDETYGYVQELNTNEFKFKDADNTFLIGNIAAGETKEVNYTLTVKEDAPLGENNFKVELLADRINNGVECSKTVTIEKGYVDIINLSSQDSTAKLKGGQQTMFVSVIKNTSNENLTNFNINYKLSEGSEIIEAGTKNNKLSNIINSENTTINTENNIATYQVKSLAAGATLFFAMRASVGHSVNNISAISYTDGTVVGKNYSNTVSKPVSKYDVAIITATSQSKDEVYEGQEIEYDYIFENIGEIKSTSNYFKGTIPEGAKLKKATMEYIHNGEKKIIETEGVKGNEFVLYCSAINIGEKATIKVILETTAFSDEEIKNKVEEKELSMSLRFSSELLENKESDPIVYYVLYNEKIHNELVGKKEQPENPDKPEQPENPDKPEQPENPDKPDNPEQPDKPKQEEKYKISGKVWLDYNKNDRRDDDEKGIAGIKVKLISLAAMDFLKNEDGKEIALTTANDGSYSFENLENGKYIVVFDYGQTEYNVSQYKKEGVSNALNSDVIEKIITVEGKNITAGLTDTLEISGANIRNIDLGLSKASKFDLELTKRVSNITINNDNGIDNYDYSSGPKKLGKVEIKDKYLPSSNVIIEYTITVKNKGDVTAYVKSIVDYLPEELKFSSELNKDWYLGTDGNAYNMSLANVKLNPGESKDVVIILSKKMTENNTGLVNNDAEIFDAYNVEGIKNINATPGNKNKSENDMSTAGMIVSVKTGETVAKYTVLIVAVIAILTVGIYFIKFKILDKKI